jgi:hypothetical protein
MPRSKIRGRSFRGVSNMVAPPRRGTVQALPPEIAPLQEGQPVARKQGRPRKNDPTIYLPSRDETRKIGKIGRPPDTIAFATTLAPSRALPVPGLAEPEGPEVAAPDGMTPVAWGSLGSRQLCHRFVLTDPIAFREYMIPKISARGYWHRYFFSPFLMAAKQGDALLRAGRATGKSFAALEPEIVQHALTHPGEESMLTCLRKIHIVDRMERVIEYFETPALRQYLKKVLRSPSYMVALTTGHVIHGISVGDDPEAKTAQGKHVGLLVIEEGHQYPAQAWKKIQGTKDTRGCRVLFFGVPDGQTDSPFRLADSVYPAFAGRRFQVDREWDPHFTQADKADLADKLGGVNSDQYKQEVKAEWGNPTWSAWDMENLNRCMTLTSTATIVRASWPRYRDNDLTPADILEEIPVLPLVGIDEVMVASDIGYTEPTEAGVFYKSVDRQGVVSPWKLWARLELADRFEHDVQAAILWELALRVRATSIGIDASEGEGRAICVELDAKSGMTAIRIDFKENLFVGTTLDKDGREVEVFEVAKKHATRLLRVALKNRGLLFPRDDQIIAEFLMEKEIKTQSGETLLRTPKTCHIPDMFRVAMLTQFSKAAEHEYAGFPMPMVGFDSARMGLY